MNFRIKNTCILFFYSCNFIAVTKIPRPNLALWLVLRSLPWHSPRSFPRCSPNPFSINDLWLQCIGTQCKLSDGVMEARRAGQIEDADILFNIFRFITIFLCSIKSVIGVVGRLQPPLFIGRVRVLCENKNDRPPPRWKLGWDREKVDLLPVD